MLAFLGNFMSPDLESSAGSIVSYDRLFIFQQKNKMLTQIVIKVIKIIRVKSLQGAPSETTTRKTNGLPVPENGAEYLGLRLQAPVSTSRSVRLNRLLWLFLWCIIPKIHNAMN